MSDTRTQHRSTQRAAFSLIELLVCLVVIAILTGIILVALSGARRSARAQACALSLHQQGLLVLQYNVDYRDYFPCALSGDKDSVSKMPIDNDHPFAPLGYITLCGSRPWLAMGRVFGKERVYRRPRCPADTRPELVAGSLMPDGEPQETPASYRYSAALYIDPATLNPERSVWSRTSPRTARASEVRFPSSKALLFDAFPFHAGWDARQQTASSEPFARCVAAVDGSASLRSAQGQINGVALNVADHRLGDAELGVIYRLMLTPNGIHGKDW